MFRKIVLLTSLAGIGLFFNACTAGYVATRPSHVEFSRPQRPSDLHIWVDGNWVYRRQTNAYVQKNGYWKQPRQNNTYVAGHWQSTSRGHHWVPGRWQKQGKKGNKKSR